MIIITKHDITINRFEEEKINATTTTRKKNKWVRDTTYAKNTAKPHQITTIKLKNKVIELKICLPFFYFSLRSFWVNNFS